MIILIGGVSCTGKTLMAQRLLEKYKIPYLSIDHVKMGLIRGSQYCDFTATDSDVDLSYKLWPIVKGIIMTNVENGQHLIIEGCYLPQEYVQAFEMPYSDHIIACYIGFSQDYLAKHFESGVLAKRSVIEHKDVDDYMSLENFSLMHAAMKAACEANGAKYFEICADYELEMAEVYWWIDQQVTHLSPTHKRRSDHERQ